VAAGVGVQGEGVCWDGLVVARVRGHPVLPREGAHGRKSGELCHHVNLSRRIFRLSQKTPNFQHKFIYVKKNPSSHESIRKVVSEILNKYQPSHHISMTSAAEPPEDDQIELCMAMRGLEKDSFKL
jgi:hypothetical protein